MVDTVRTLASLQTLLADNTTEQISPQDHRDHLVSGWTPGHIRAGDHRLPHETAHADDIFPAQGVVPGTAVNPSATPTWTSEGGQLGVTAASTGAFAIHARAFSMTPSSPPVTIETRFDKIGALNTNGSGFHIGFSNGTATSSTVLGFGVLTTNLTYKHNGGTFASANFTSDTTLGIWNRPLYVRCVWTAANTAKLAVSPGGGAWTALGFTSASTTISPTHFFVGVTTDQATVMAVVIDPIRVYESDLSV